MATSTVASQDAGPEDAGFIARQIEALAQRCLEAQPGQAARRPGTDSSGEPVELLIGEVLRLAERSEPGPREAPREVCVLRRDDVHREVRRRVEAHLRGRSSAA